MQHVFFAKKYTQYTACKVTFNLSYRKKIGGAGCTNCSPNNFSGGAPCSLRFPRLWRYAQITKKTITNYCKWRSYNIPCSIKIVHLCLIWCRVVRSRDVHPCYMVSRCPVPRFQSPQTMIPPLQHDLSSESELSNFPSHHERPSLIQLHYSCPFAGVGLRVQNKNCLLMHSAPSAWSPVYLAIWHTYTVSLDHLRDVCCLYKKYHARLPTKFDKRTCSLFNLCRSVRVERSPRRHSQWNPDSL